MPSLVSNLGSSCPEMLNIIHNPPEGSVHLITLVYHPFRDLCLYTILMKISSICLFFYFLILKILQTLTDESTPSADLVAAVKQLYNTLKVCIKSALALYCSNSLVCTFDSYLFVYLTCLLSLVTFSGRMHPFLFLCCLHFQRKRYMFQILSPHRMSIICSGASTLITSV